MLRDGSIAELDPVAYNKAIVKAYWTYSGYNKWEEFSVEDKEEEKKNKTMRFIMYVDEHVINKEHVDMICQEFHKVWKQLLL